MWRELSPRASLKFRAAGVTPALISRMVFCHRSRVGASAVPAVLRYAIPEAKPAMYFGMSLGLTFPFNIMLGIPLYMGVAHQVLG